MDLKQHYMEKALTCAIGVKGTTSPNPSVGAVIVKEGEIIGKGATSPYGGPHAEINAIRDAGGEACCHGADIYVTLEPCSHYGKTPPCSEALIRAKFKRVFIAVLDPNPLVSGRGVTQLEEAGIEVEIGLCEEAAFRINEDFFHFIQHKRPFVHVKMALTLDGMIADTVGKSKWITGPDSRTEVHRLRSQCSAIVVGKGTLQADNPKLNVRHVDGSSPIRIVFGSDVSDIKGTYFEEHAHEVRSILVLPNASKNEIVKRENDVELWYIDAPKGVESMTKFMDMAASENIDSLFVEGGAGLVSTLLEAQFVHRLTLFYGPKILGGGKRALQMGEPRSISLPVELTAVESKQFGSDFMVTGIPSW